MSEPTGEKPKTKDVIAEQSTVTMDYDSARGRSNEKAPEGWVTAKGVVNLLGKLGLSVAPKTIQKEVGIFIKQRLEKGEEWQKDVYRGESGKIARYYHPDLVDLLHTALSEREYAPEGWKTRKSIQRFLKEEYVSAAEESIQKTIDTILAAHPDKQQEWKSDKFITPDRQKATHYHPDLVALIVSEHSSREKPPENWKSVRDLERLFRDKDRSFHEHTIQNVIDIILDNRPDKKQEWQGAQFIAENRKKTTYYPPDFVAFVVEEISKREKPPDGWVSVSGIVGTLEKRGIRTTFKTTQNKIDAKLQDYSDVERGHLRGKFLDSVGRVNTYYHPDLEAAIVSEFSKQEIAPKDWKTLGGVVSLLQDRNIRVAFPTVQQVVESFLDVNKGRLGELVSDSYLTHEGRRHVTHYHPDLVAKVIEHFTSQNEKPQEEEKKKRRFVDYIVDLKNTGLELDEFNKILNIFGSAHVVDILYRLHPEFRELPVEYVKGILADYLGDMLVVRGKFTLRDLKSAAEKMPPANLTEQERYYEALKNHCLQYYFSQRRSSEQSSSDIIYGYIDHIAEELGDIKNLWLDDVVQGVIAYYDSVLKDFRKPDGFVDELSEDREFPDINQRINMKELADKKRLLIADQMGLGKSASVIMAKEQLGVRCALVVAPSNVVSTWRRYLSEYKKDEKTGANVGGYFEAGKAPRVLVVENVKDLQDVNGQEYDYVLISQEKMNERYTALLDGLGYDMLVVDEVHKLKSQDAVRTQGLLPLARKIEGEDKYLALLSGTPVPNKVQDVATLLRLLYPDEFTDISDKALVKMIISGNIEGLREYLVPRMQAKRLEEAVEMPVLREDVVEYELSETEKEIYEVLLENDELPPTVKMQTMRQFLLNPRLAEVTPNFEGAKIQALRAEVQTAFAECDKVLMFVNGYVKGVIRGEDNIVGDLQVPAGVTVRVIHGENKNEREEIEKQFQNTDERMLLIVSGGTADVGVNFSRAQRVIMANEPWTVADKDQQIARAYRFGLQNDLTVRTLIAKGTLEEGIHEYILRKDKAIHKLINGIPLSEREQEMLTQDETQGPLDPGQEINPDLARYYFSSWDKLMQFFAYVKEQGEEKFKTFLEEYGIEYASAYLNMGSRSYQSNINRVSGTLLKSWIDQLHQDPRQLKILDVASGPEMLRRHIHDDLQSSVVSLDINQFHFPWDEHEPGTRIVGSWTELPSVNIPGGTMDYVNLAMSLHYTSYVPSRGDYERVKVLQSINHVLKTGGRAVVSMIYTMELRSMELFKQAVETLGFKVIDEYSGDVEAGSQFRSQIVTLEKVSDVSQEVSEKMKEHTDGLKLKRIERRLKDSRKVLSAFTLANRGYVMELNKKDSAILHEEKEVTEEGRRLKEKYGNVQSIPSDEVVAHNFVRLLAWKKYVLFKKLASGPGVVLIN